MRHGVIKKMEDFLLHAKLSQLASDIPRFAKDQPISTAQHKWLGSVHALLKRWNDFEALSFRSASDNLSSQFLFDLEAPKISSILYRALGDLELRLPQESSQVFGSGAQYDLYKALSSVLTSSDKSLFLIDPYFNESNFDAYLCQVKESITVRALCTKVSQGLPEALKRFIAQKKLAVEIRKSPKQSVHDRVVFVDETECWLVGSSFETAARLSPTYIAPLPTDLVAEKRKIYESIWNQASPIL